VRCPTGQFTNRSSWDVQEQLGQFNAYRNVEKPPKFMEKGNLEVLLFTLQSTMPSHNKVPHCFLSHLILYTFLSNL
jgi:spectrin beta